MSRVHVVRSGECLSTIAAHYGFRDFHTIYDHADNKALKKKRPNPNLIHPGDKVAIPDVDERTEEIATGKSHRFKIVVPKKKIALRLLDEAGKPIKNAPWLLTVGSDAWTGDTDGDGKVETAVPVRANYAELECGGRVYRLHIGALNPLRDAEGPSGAAARLGNHGIEPGDEGDQFHHAVAVIELLHDVEVSGGVDDATVSKLEEKHAC